MDNDLRDALPSHLIPLQLCGPDLGRPAMDTLKGSQHGNMKELRIKHVGGGCRVALDFDPERNGILLVAGDKRGADHKKFYKTLIKIAALSPERREKVLAHGQALYAQEMT